MDFTLPLTGTKRRLKKVHRHTYVESRGQTAEGLAQEHGKMKERISGMSLDAQWLHYVTCHEHALLHLHVRTARETATR